MLIIAPQDHRYGNDTPREQILQFLNALCTVVIGFVALVVEIVFEPQIKLQDSTLVGTSDSIISRATCVTPLIYT